MDEGHRPNSYRGFPSFDRFDSSVTKAPPQPHESAILRLVADENALEQWRSNLAAIRQGGSHPPR
jgi:hypothetical protein